jgi:hypothetical protein
MKLKCLYENTYWNHKGKHSALADALNKLVPNTGEVKDPEGNPHLERFRKASNCYYDLYNNGLCNQSGEFEHVFGFALGDCVTLTADIVNDTERAMNRIILAAAKEQHIQH